MAGMYDNPHPKPHPSLASFRMPDQMAMDFSNEMDNMPIETRPWIIGPDGRPMPNPRLAPPPPQPMPIPSGPAPRPTMQRPGLGGLRRTPEPTPEQLQQLEMLMPMLRHHPMQGPRMIP